MVHEVALLLVSILCLLAFLHLYWLFGGSWGKASTLPTRAKSGEKLFSPRWGSTLAVAVALMAAASLVAWRGGLLTLPLSTEVAKVGTWGVAAVFLLRAIGDFRYLGLFKRVRSTRFARMDTLVFTPLCLAVSVLAAWVALVP